MSSCFFVFFFSPPQHLHTGPHCFLFHIPPPLSSSIYHLSLRFLGGCPVSHTLCNLPTCCWLHFLTFHRSNTSSTPPPSFCGPLPTLHTAITPTCVWLDFFSTRVCAMSHTASHSALQSPLSPSSLHAFFPPTLHFCTELPSSDLLFSSSPLLYFLPTTRKQTLTLFVTRPHQQASAKPLPTRNIPCSLPIIMAHLHTSTMPKCRNNKITHISSCHMMPHVWYMCGTCPLFNTHWTHFQGQCGHGEVRRKARR